MTMHTYTPNQCPYQVSTSYTLTVPEIEPGKTPATHPNAHQDMMGENNTTALAQDFF